MKTVCAHCGLPFSTPRPAPGPVYCCTGCALASRVSGDASGPRPADAALVAALGLGFAFFNQILFWLLAALVARQAGDAHSTVAARFELGSLVAGAGVWAATAFLQFRVGARRVVDGLFLAAGAAVLVAACLATRPVLAAAANAALLAWATRGVFRPKTSGKNPPS